MAKFEVGEFVIIRNDLKDFEKRTNPNNIISPMFRYSGETATITKSKYDPNNIYSDWIYKLDVDNETFEWVGEALLSLKAIERNEDIIEISKNNDMVNSPKHYSDKEIEVIDYIEDTLSKDGFIGHMEGNIIKYISRYRHKNGVEDLKKADWYLNRLIEFLEG